MKNLSLETLTAYVDDELDEASRPAVQEAILRDGSVRATVDRLRSSRAALSHAFAEVIDTPVPARLIETLRRDADLPHPTVVVPLHRPARRQQNWQPLALAASLALTVGLSVGFMVANSERSSSQQTTASLLQHGLETMQTGRSLSSTDGEVTITSLSSFRVQDGRICREFEQQSGDARSNGIACRDPSTLEWQTQIEVTTARSLSSESSGELYAPASGALDPLNWVFDQLGAGPAFGATEETRLIDNQWQD